MQAGTVVDEERGHEGAGRERDVEAEQHVGEARREDRLPDVLAPAAPDRTHGRFEFSPKAEGGGGGPTCRTLGVVEDAVGEPVHRPAQENLHVSIGASGSE